MGSIADRETRQTGRGLEIGGTVSKTSSMNRLSCQRPAFSKVSAKSRTLIPREVCEYLKLKPDDTLRYRVVRAANIACIEPARIERRAGRLDKATAKAVAQKMKGFLGIA
ncbi:MAG: hypothetical protein WB420_16555 [Bradyrhizobium sp.]